MSHSRRYAGKEMTMKRLLCPLLGVALAALLAVTPPPSQAPPPRAGEGRKDLVGTWVAATALIDGESFDATTKIKVDRFRFEISQGKLVFRHPQGSDKATCTLGPAADGGPRTIDLVLLRSADKGKSMPGVYELNGDTLKLAFGKVGGRRPTDFQRGFMVFVLKRQTGTRSK
jgi:uncharacterized protein (TIGR03067 family)